MEAKNLPRMTPQGKRRAQAAQRSERLIINCTPATKAKIRDAALNMMMHQTEFLQWLIEHYASGHVLIIEEGGLLDGMFDVVKRTARACCPSSSVRSELHRLSFPQVSFSRFGRVNGKVVLIDEEATVLLVVEEERTITICPVCQLKVWPFPRRKIYCSPQCAHTAQMRRYRQRRAEEKARK